VEKKTRRFEKEVLKGIERDMKEAGGQSVCLGRREFLSVE
jgi:hypothetical protein